jgi:serine/threonine-protein kinase
VGDLPSTPLPPVAEGRTLAGRYRLERRIAGGGMASVWEATDEVLARQVAVKLLHPHLAADETFVARFRREAVAAARLAHPSIVSIYDTVSVGEAEPGADPACEAIVMELVRGPTLRQELDRRGAFAPADAVAVVADAADALDTAHRAGIVHRDVKPANVLLSADGRVLVADFGIAKAADDLDITGTGTTLGTAKYLAPEQVEGGPVDARTDVYALGIVLYELLCGRPPFQADSEAATALARLHREPLRPRQVKASVPRALERVVQRAMARRPDDRYPSAAALRTALLAAARETDTLPEEDPGADETSFTGFDLEATGADATGVDATGVAAPPPPAPAPRWVGPPPAPAPAGRRRHAAERRRWAGPAALAAVLAAALGVIGALIVGTGDDGAGRPPSSPAEAAEDGTALDIAGISSFDPPPGSGDERDDLLPNADDGDRSTTWQTEGYASADFGGLGKTGVGLVVELDRVADIGAVTIDGPSAGWSVEVYVADGPAGDLAAWGERVAAETDIPAGPSTFPLDGTEGGAVLLLVTLLTAEDDGSFRVQIGELAVTGA